MHKKRYSANINIRNGVGNTLKSTGVIRRIDELGRIVIPKEIRRNLGIRDGENVEIFTEAETIILKKYNRMSSNNELASSLCELINNIFNFRIMITDREKIIASSGFDKEIESKKLNEDLLKIIEEREIIIKEEQNLKLEDIEVNGNFVFIPIISLNDSIGLVILYNENKITDEANIGKLAANIFARKLDI